MIIRHEQLLSSQQRRPKELVPRPHNYFYKSKVLCDLFVANIIAITMDHSLLLHPQYKQRRVKKKRNLDGGLVNCLLCFAVILSLWTLWSVPSSGDAGSDSLNDSSSSSSPYYYYRNNLLVQGVSTPSRQLGAALSVQQPQANHHHHQQPPPQQLVPVFFDQKARPTALVHPRHLQMVANTNSNNIPSPQEQATTNTRGFDSTTSVRTSTSSLSGGVASRRPPSTTTTTTTATNSNSVLGGTSWRPQTNNAAGITTTSTTKQRQQHGSFSRTLASVAAAAVEKEASSATASSSTLQGTTFLLVASCSIVLGALTAKKAIERAQQWEQESQEDSLAYDLAYTDNGSDVSYGSFVSTGWSDELDKFDV